MTLQCVYWWLSISIANIGDTSVLHLDIDMILSNTAVYTEWVLKNYELSLYLDKIVSDCALNAVRDNVIKIQAVSANNISKSDKRFRNTNKDG